MRELLDRSRHLLDGGRLILGGFAQVVGALGDDSRALAELTGRLDDLADQALQVRDHPAECLAQPAHVVFALDVDGDRQVSLGRGLGRLHELIDLGFEVALGLIDAGLLVHPLECRRDQSPHVPKRIEPALRRRDLVFGEEVHRAVDPVAQQNREANARP